MNVKFTTTTASKLPDLAITNGQLVYLQDIDEAYYDMSDTRRRIGGVKKVTELPSVGREGTIYVVINNDGKADASIWDSTSSSFAPLSGYLATSNSFGIVKPDGTTITISDGVLSAVASTVAPATTATLGTVQPDGVTILVDGNGVISSAATVAPATTAAAGIVQPDGTTITVDGGVISAALPAAATTATLGVVQPDGTSVTVDGNGVISAVTGNTISKKRYTISSSSWSANPDASGYYTYTITLSDPTLDTSFAPSIYLTGATDSTFATATEQSQFDLMDQCDLTSSSTLVLYAKTKPTSTFYVLVEGTISAS